MQAVVRAVARATVESGGAGAGGGVDEEVKRAQQARLDRLRVPAAAGVGPGASRLLCVALSPPLRTDPLTAKQVEGWLGADGRGDVSFAVMGQTSSRLTIHGQDGCVVAQSSAHVPTHLRVRLNDSLRHFWPSFF